MKKILVCEDEEVIRDFVVINLKRAGYQVVDVCCGEDALAAFEQQHDFDIALLDIMMPGIDGLEVCKKLRAESPTMGIIMLTAKSQEMDKVGSLMMGADDYVTKPFSPSELVARVDALYRRVEMNSSRVRDTSPIVSGRFVLSPKSRTLMKDGEYIDLTQMEYQIMALLFANRNIALGRAQILEEIWGDNYFGDVKIVDVNIRRLRMKIEENPSNPQYIQTVWGYGYKWNEDTSEH